MKQKIKLFYTNVDGEDTYLIAEGEDVGKAGQNAIEEFKKNTKNIWRTKSSNIVYSTYEFNS